MGSRNYHDPQYWDCLVYAICGHYCHMRNNVTYPILRHMLGYTNDQQCHR